MSRRSGLLIYAAADIPRNQWFIDELCRCAESEGLTLRLCTAESGVPADDLPDFVINRSRDHKISSFCEETLRIPVYNSTAVTQITNDKYRTHLFLQAHQLPTAPTVRIADGAPIPALDPPLVAKPCDGHGGTGVQWIADAHALRQTLRETARPFLLQAPMMPGWDLRVYLLGGTVYAAMLRTAEQDFRSNFSLGGTARAVTPDAEICALVQRVQRALPLDFAGIDFLRHPAGGYVIGEIEDAVGCRMLYQHTALNPARDYMQHIAARLAAC